MGEPQSGAEYVQSHLAHELEYMLAATTTWCGCHPDQRGRWPKHLVATAEYAAFVHQRCMFEFFCESGGAYDARSRVGHPGAFASDLYDDWETPLNDAVMHMWKRWQNQPPHVGREQLKNQVAAFASDIIRMWGKLESAVPDIAPVLAIKRDRAFQVAEEIRVKMGAPTLDWSQPDPFVVWGERKWWPVD